MMPEIKDTKNRHEEVVVISEETTTKSDDDSDDDILDKLSSLVAVDDIAAEEAALHHESSLHPSCPSRGIIVVGLTILYFVLLIGACGGSALIKHNRCGEYCDSADDGEYEARIEAIAVLVTFGLTAILLSMATCCFIVGNWRNISNCYVKIIGLIPIVCSVTLIAVAMIISSA